MRPRLLALFAFASLAAPAQAQGLIQIEQFVRGPDVEPWCHLEIREVSQNSANQPLRFSLVNRTDRTVGFVMDVAVPDGPRLTQATLTVRRAGAGEARTFFTDQLVFGVARSVRLTLRVCEATR